MLYFDNPRNMFEDMINELCVVYGKDSEQVKTFFEMDKNFATDEELIDYYNSVMS